MKSPRFDKNSLSDFIDFLSAKEKMPSSELTNSLFTQIKGELQPSPVKVFLKLAVIHLFSGAVTLSFCPQLGFSPYHDSMGIMEYFMGLGSIGCALACGSLLFGVSMCVGAFLLKREEVRVVHAHKLGNISILCALSYGFLMLVGGEAELLYSVFWLLGGILGGDLALILISRIKSRLSPHS